VPFFILNAERKSLTSTFKKTAKDVNETLSVDDDDDNKVKTSSRIVFS
jgi:hypothetical protein